MGWLNTSSSSCLTAPPPLMTQAARAHHTALPQVAFVLALQLTRHLPALLDWLTEPQSSGADAPSSNGGAVTAAAAAAAKREQ
jgi:hypothetical protein